MVKSFVGFHITQKTWKPKHFKPTPITQCQPQQLSSVAPPAMSCCPSLPRSFVSNGWRSLLPSLWQAQIKRCTQDGWVQSEWKIGGQAKIFSCFFSPFSFPFAAFCQIDDVRGKYYLYCFHCWSCLVLLGVAISIWMTEPRDEAKVKDLRKWMLYCCRSTNKRN